MTTKGDFVETNLLLAVMGDDEGEAERLINEMLSEELVQLRLSLLALERMIYNRLVSIGRFRR